MTGRLLVCCVCRQVLPEDEFHRSLTRQSRRQSTCKACKRERDRLRQQHPARLRQRAANAWKRQNRDRVLGHNAARRSRAAASGRGQPGVDLPYRLARAARGLGADVVVDHWLPLRGREVCGMHVAANLVLVHAADNLAKWRKVPDFDPPAIALPVAVPIRSISGQPLRSEPL